MHTCDPSLAGREELIATGRVMRSRFVENKLQLKHCCLGCFVTKRLTTFTSKPFVRKKSMRLMDSLETWSQASLSPLMICSFSLGRTGSTLLGSKAKKLKPTSWLGSKRLHLRLVQTSVSRLASPWDRWRLRLAVPLLLVQPLVQSSPV